MMRWLMCRTIARLCEMKMSARPYSRCRSISRLTICAWIETSSAETGSSQTMQLRPVDHGARDADALALAAGEFVRVAVDLLRQQPDLGHHRLDARAPILGAYQLRVEGAQRLGDDLADRHARIERGERILEDDLHRLALRGRMRLGLEPREILRRARRRGPGRSAVSRSTARPRVDLPQPDSPTRPSVSPGVELEARRRRPP